MLSGDNLNTPLVIINVNELKSQMSAHVRSNLTMEMGNGRGGAGDGSPGFHNLPRMFHSNVNNSPLQIFVQAKKKINDIFKDIDDYVGEASGFISQIPAEHPVVTEEQCKDIQEHAKKVACIREVLSRDHMKVAFFGRTSNGKSTVINAMLREKVLPSGIGHTTSCFLQVEGSETGESYVELEDSPVKQPVKSVGQLANALCSEKLSESALVRVFWPKEKCPLLRDDVVFVDSPGIDVSPNLDEWIDKHCLDADVFVLVANAESTLMVTEKSFFHKVSQRLSKPNIFILNNRWDASASEPESDQVRGQHLERASDFLTKELKVISKEQVKERVFFTSAKEVLNARLLQESKGQPVSGGSMVEGFMGRYMEFEDFERKFEECISKSAMKTKFEQHSQRGKLIAKETNEVLDKVYTSATKLKEEKLRFRKELWDKIDFTDKQLQLLTNEMKDKIRQMVEDVECKVSKALSEEIRRLGNLVDEFNARFHPDPLVLNIYKRELHNHVEAGLGSNLRARLSTAVALNMENSQKEMTERMAALLPQEKRQLSSHLLSQRREPFEVLYRLNCDNLCSDFQENIAFRFSFGVQALMQRFYGNNKSRKSWWSGQQQPTLNHKPRGLPPPQQLSPMLQTPTENVQTPFFTGSSESDLSILSHIAVAGIASQGTMGGLLIAGFALKTIGWRIIAFTGIVYGGLYVYERLTWTNKAKEREFKRQYVEHATKKLRLIVDLTSANCSHQVQQELSSTFARLCHLVDSSTSEMENEMKSLEDEIKRLEELADSSKTLKNKANYLVNELSGFEEYFLSKV